MASCCRGLELLRPDHGQQRKSLGVLGSWRRGEDDQLLGLVLRCQNLTVERDQADDRMQDALARVGANGDLVPLPELGELAAPAAELVDELDGFAVVGALAVGRAQTRGVAARVELMVCLRKAAALLGIGEPAVDDAALGTGMPGLHAEQRLGERVLPERHAKVGDDLRRRVEHVEHAYQGRAHVVRPVTTRRGHVPSEPEEVVALILCESQRASDRGDGLLGGPRPSPLLESGVEVGRHVRQRGDLLASQSGRAPSPPLRETEVLRPQRLAAAAEKVGEALTIHLRSIGHIPSASQGSVLPGYLDLWCLRQRRLSMTPNTDREGSSLMTTSPRIALITGANRGIGRSAALQLARNGVDVIVTYRSHADEAEAVVASISDLGRSAVALQLDTGDIESLDAFVATVTDALQQTWNRDSFDFLVNNGGMSIAGSLATVTVHDFDRLVGVHFKGVFFLTQKISALLADNGAIVNISTGLTRFTGPERMIYASVKGAVEVLTRYLAEELGPRGITVNTIAPGAVATDFSGGLLRDNEQLRQHIVSLTALGRYAVADDIGGAIAALLGEGNRWVTGQRIEVSGGLHL
jgi:NAD(P)-dependent dehydrogenase (short-subunit alcohol dehydrogenase family)